MITHHTTLLNALIEKYNLRSYLEIGVQNPENNFEKIICEQKVGVDPSPTHYVNGINIMTSDEFFHLLVNPKTEIINGKPYTSEWLYHPDICFIDGNHTKEQVKKDFENCLACLSDNGFIVIHDVLPTEEITTCVPRGSQKIWHGDVYKFAMHVYKCTGIGMKTFNIDNGCMLIWKDLSNTAMFKDCGFCWGEDWESYVKYGHRLMNVTDIVEI